MLKRRSKVFLTWGIGLGLLALAFANPYTRPVILFILPLGSGVDDLFEIGVIVAAFLLVCFALILKWAAKKKEEKRNEW